MDLESGLAHKLDDLKGAIRGFGRVAVAFSGGVDSTLLLKVCKDVLDDGVIAVTACSPSIPAREIDAATEFCASEEIRLIKVETHEFEIPGFIDNPPNRCYLCKREILSRLVEAAKSEGFGVLVEGSNADDVLDYRPGSKAVSELGVKSPLQEAGLTKAEVRELARSYGLKVWDKPAFACLNTRFAFGDRIDPRRLAAVDAVEGALIDLGFALVRARVDGASVRIELDAAEIARAASDPIRPHIVEACKAAGFEHVAIDLEGYRRGSMNALVGD